MAKYTKKYSTGRSVGFIVPLLALMFVAAMYLLVSRNGQSGASFILVTVATGFVIYWVREIRKMSNPSEQKVTKIHRDAEQQKKDWVYDLIKNNDGTIIFVAEVPGPEDKINVGLSKGTLKIKGGQNFSKDVQLETTPTVAIEMVISEYKYRNGVLTIRLQRQEG